MSKILVVDDHEEIRELLGKYLTQQGFQVKVAEDGVAMKAVLAANTVDLIILDVMLPGDDGLTLCRYLREETDIPVIMLSALGEDTDKIVGLEIGADDYLTKPFNPRELLARVRSVVRRAQPTEPKASPEVEAVEFNGWHFDIKKQQLTRSDKIVVPLSTGEFKLLKVFVLHPHEVLSRDNLLEMTQGREAQPFDRAIDNQVSRLRKKLEPDAKQPELIKTVWGGGYSFTCDVNAL